MTLAIERDYEQAFVECMHRVERPKLNYTEARKGKRSERNLVRPETGHF